jgi:hypothetical protein
MVPQYVKSPAAFIRPCADGFYMLEPGTLVTEEINTESDTIRAAIHEVNRGPQRRGGPGSATARLSTVLLSGPGVAKGSEVSCAHAFNDDEIFHPLTCIAPAALKCADWSLVRPRPYMGPNRREPARGLSSISRLQKHCHSEGWRLRWC